MRLNAIPRTLVRQGLRGLRLPLDVTEGMARRLGIVLEDEWYPARAFEGLEGDTKRVLGALLRDEVLVQEGRRHRARAEELRRASVLADRAERTRLEADARFEQRHALATRQHQAVDETARRLERERALARAGRRKQVREAASEEEQMAAEVDAERRAFARRAERAARSTKLAEESAVLEHERRAVEADAEADQLGRAAARKKAQRKSS
jgi:hypothetical protein